MGPKPDNRAIEHRGSTLPPWAWGFEGHGAAGPGAGVEMTSRARIGALMGEALAPAPDPTGRVTRFHGEAALAFERRLQTNPTRVWSLLTDPVLAEVWVGRWTLDPASAVIEFRGLTEGVDTEPVRYRLEDLVPRRRVEVTTPVRAGDEAGWRIRLELTAGPAGGTLLTLLETVPDPAFAPLVGAAADFYLDRLVVLAQGEDPSEIDYDDYVAGQAGHYRALFPAQRRRP